MVTREDVVNFLNRMEMDYEEVSDGMWLAYPDEEHGGAPVVISHSPPLLVFRLKVLDVPRDGEKCAQLYKRLLQANASEMVHAAYGLEEEDVILTDSLQLENLDFNEFQATVDSFQMAMATQMEALTPFRDC
jgi:Tir chaperone protein (CesT) family